MVLSSSNDFHRQRRQWFAAALCAASVGLAYGVAAEEFAPVNKRVETIEPSGTVKLRAGRSILLRTKVDLHRTAIADEMVCDIVQFTPREISIVGRSAGQTQVTFWFDDASMAPLTYLVEVQLDPQ